MVQGDDWQNQVTWQINGAPVDLTNATVELRIKASHAKASKVLLTLDNMGNGGITVSTPLSGVADVEITKVQSALLPAGTWAKEWAYILANGERKTRIQGYFVIKAGG